MPKKCTRVKGALKEISYKTVTMEVQDQDSKHLCTLRSAQNPI